MSNLKNMVQFKDDNLKLSVLKKLKKKPTEEVTIEEMKNIKDFMFVEGTTNLSGLEHAINLQILTISNNKITDLEPVRSMSSLKTLFMENTEIVDLRPLEGVLTLETLWCQNNSIMSLEGLDNLPKLRSLNLFDCSQINDLEPINNISSLTMLDIRGTNITNIESISKSINMEYFYANQCELDSVSPLSDFTKIKNLMLDNTGMTNDDMDMFSNFQDLVILTMSNNHVSDISKLNSIKGNLKTFIARDQEVVLDALIIDNEKIDITSVAKGFDGNVLEPLVTSNGKIEGTNIKWSNIEEDCDLVYTFKQDSRFNGTVTIFIIVNLSNISDGDSNGDNIVNEDEILLNIIEVEISDSISIVISEKQNAFACGSNKYGQLGIGNVGMVEVKELTRVKLRHIERVITSGLHTFFITDEGIYACGKNFQGQLGLGHYNDVYIPEKVDIGVVSEIVCSKYNTFFIMEDGSVKCCGTNACGELGLGHRNSVATIERVKIDSNIRSIKTQNRTTIFETEDGYVYGCGDNRHGMLGTGSSNITEVTTPMKFRIAKK